MGINEMFAMKKFNCRFILNKAFEFYSNPTTTLVHLYPPSRTITLIVPASIDIAPVSTPHAGLIGADAFPLAGPL